MTGVSQALRKLKNRINSRCPKRQFFRLIEFRPDFASPCQLASLKTGGDTETQDMEHLVAAMVPNTECRFSDLLALSRDHELFVRLSPAEGEPERCKAQSSAAFSRSSSDAFLTRSGYTAPRLSGTKTSTLTRGIPSRVSRWAYDAILDQARERGVHPTKICA